MNDYIKKCLLNYIDTRNSEDNRVGRIGPSVVRFDTAMHHGLCMVSPDRLSVNSQSSFSTMRANTAVFKGKWMYEVQLGSKGVMQVGWGTAQCKFNQHYGVGTSQGNLHAYSSQLGCFMSSSGKIVLCALFSQLETLVSPCSEFNSSLSFLCSSYAKLKLII